MNIIDSNAAYKKTSLRSHFCNQNQELKQRYTNKKPTVKTT